MVEITKVAKDSQPGRNRQGCFWKIVPREVGDLGANVATLTVGEHGHISISILPRPTLTARQAGGPTPK
jgi:hypothetical protein